MKPSYAIAQKKIDAIEAEMKRIGYWQSEPLDPDQYDFERAFAMDTMAFSQWNNPRLLAGWLQFIFIPRGEKSSPPGKVPRAKHGRHASRA